MKRAPRFSPWTLGVLMGCARGGGPATPITPLVAEPKAACELVQLPSPELDGFVVVAVSGQSKRIEETGSDHFRTTVEEVTLERMSVRYAIDAPASVGRWIEVRSAGCTEAGLRAEPYWNGGPLTLMRRGDVFVIAWSPDSSRQPLVAFRAKRDP